MNDPENASPEELAERLGRRAREILQWNAYLLTQGLDVTDFFAAMVACERAEDGDAPAESSDEAVEVVTAFIAKVDALPEFPPKFPKAEAAMWCLAGDILLGEDESAQSIALGLGLPEPSAALKTEVESLRERLRKALRAGKSPKEEFDMFRIFLHAEIAEVNRQARFRDAATMMFWEVAPKCDWDSLTARERKQTKAALAKWKKGRREQVLSELPIEDRRRLERLDRIKPEDWDKPGGPTA
jgi:hypothetical protein